MSKKWTKIDVLDEEGKLLCTIPITEEEYDKLKREAEKYELTISEYLQIIKDSHFAKLTILTK